MDTDKVREEEKFDGKWVLITNTVWSADRVALKYKDLWRVEQTFRTFRDLKSTFETRPVFHQRDDTIRGQGGGDALNLLTYIGGCDPLCRQGPEISGLDEQKLA